MGKKGATLIKKATDSCRQTVEALSGSGEITSKKMFGGYGIFEGGVMFALVNSEGELFLKVNDQNINRFEEAGSKKHGKMPYYEVPEQVLKDHALFVEWAQVSIEIAHSSKKK
ncbi:TfoX/Sxy family protein [Thermodesulfobacteriota bacterium]